MLTIHDEIAKTALNFIGQSISTEENQLVKLCLTFEEDLLVKSINIYVNQNLVTILSCIPVNCAYRVIV